MGGSGKSMRAALAAQLVLLGALGGLAAADPAGAVENLTGAALSPAKPVVHRLESAPPHWPIDIEAGTRDWRGAAAGLAGSAHYDRGEWIFENHPWTAYGAATPEMAQAVEALEAGAETAPQGSRLPSSPAIAGLTAGAGPHVDEADVAELRIAVRGEEVHVLARTTTMRRSVRTALLLLFDTGGESVEREVPFGSGLRTRAADTAALVTAAGTRIVDLASGEETSARAAADPSRYRNSLQTRLPLAKVSDGAEIRVVGATGLVEPGSYELLSNGSAGPLAAVVPRFDEPVQMVYERRQALALHRRDIDEYLTPVSLRLLRRGRRERLAPGPGFSVRTFVASKEIALEEAALGRLQTYGLFMPRDFSGGVTPATVFMAGSNFTASGHAALQPSLFRQLGDENGAIMITPGTHTGVSLYGGAAYLYVEEVLADAERRYPIDRNRLTLSGYSMGGYGTFLFAGTQPDRFAAGFPIAGPISEEDQGPVALAVPDLRPGFANLEHVPLEIYQAAQDVNVPIFNGLDAAERLRELGYRYRLDIFQGDHYTPGIVDDYTHGQLLLRDARRVRRPARVRFSRSMPMERAIDTGEGGDDPARGKSAGLRFDKAWFVSRLRPTDAVAGTAAVDVRTFARPQDVVTPVPYSGVDPGGGSQAASLYDGQRWELAPPSEPLRNAFDATFTGTSAVILDLRRMGLTIRRPLEGSVRSEDAIRLVLRLPARSCVAAGVDGKALRRAAGRSFIVRLTPGSHALELRSVRGCE